MRSYLVLIATSLFAVAPCWANLVTNVSVNGTVSGSGQVTAFCDFTPAPDCNDQGVADRESFSFNEANHQIGAFSASGSVSADSGRVTISGSGTQTTDVSLTSLSVDLSSSASLDAIGARFGDIVNVANFYTVTFTVTVPSEMHITSAGSLSGVGWELDGPGLPAGGLLESLAPIDQTFTAGPGTYVFTTGGQLVFGPSFTGSETHLSAMDQFSWTADFTAVPEPARIGIVPALFVFIRVAFLARRRKRA